MGVTSEDGRIGAVGRKGPYTRLGEGTQEQHRPRTDLAEAPENVGEPLLTIAHLSDLHVCDHQSPARIELLSRLADPDSTVREKVTEIGAYRAQEMLTTQVVAAMVEAVNEVIEGPVGGGALDIAISTGDNTDNGQANELEWYLTLLEGGHVRPDSGDPGRYEGVADDEQGDKRYWHPEGTGYDMPRGYCGFPTVPGLLDAARASFRSPGLDVPWLAVHGNHDRLIQGTVPSDGFVGEVSTGSHKPISMPEHWTDATRADFLNRLLASDPKGVERLAELGTREVTPDPFRRHTTLQEFVDAHVREGAEPPGHGFRTGGHGYYRFDTEGPVSFLVLDTVNAYGGWQGSLDRDQLEWLDSELYAVDTAGRLAVIASHHPLHCLVNDFGGPDRAERVLAEDVEAVVGRHKCAVLWLNGHTHTTTVRPHGSWWEVTAPSLIDWPQQGRVVEILAGEGILTIATTMLDHAAPARWSGSLEGVLPLASLSRELAANDWQAPDVPLARHARAGTATDRNVLLYLRDPRG